MVDQEAAAKRRKIDLGAALGDFRGDDAMSWQR